VSSPVVKIEWSGREISVYFPHR